MQKKRQTNTFVIHPCTFVLTVMCRCHEKIIADIVFLDMLAIYVLNAILLQIA